MKSRKEVQEYPNESLKDELMDKIKDDRVIVKINDGLPAINGQFFYLGICRVNVNVSIQS